MERLFGRAGRAKMISFPTIAKALCVLKGHDWKTRYLYVYGGVYSVRKCKDCPRKEIQNSMGEWKKYSDADFKEIVKVEF